MHIQHISAHIMKKRRQVRTTINGNMPALRHTKEEI